jgi:hypothetical protein
VLDEPLDLFPKAVSDTAFALDPNDLPGLEQLLKTAVSAVSSQQVTKDGWSIADSGAFDHADGFAINHADDFEPGKIANANPRSPDHEARSMNEVFSPRR